MATVSEHQASETRDEFLELYRNQADDDPGIVVREEETHALLSLHEELVEGGVTDEAEKELLEFVEDELVFRESGDQSNHSLPSNEDSEWEWKSNLQTTSLDAH